MSADAEYIAAFLLSVRARGICADTVRAYRTDLERFKQSQIMKQMGSLLCVTFKDVQQYCRELRESCGYVPQTMYHKTHVLYEFYQWLLDEGAILINPVPRPTLRKVNRFVRLHPSQNAVRSLLDILTDSPDKHDRRSSALVDLAYCCGLRRCELVRLNVQDVNPVDGTVRVCGKYGKERLVPVGKKTMQSLLYYLYHVRPTFLHGGVTDALFVSWMQGGRRISKECITRIFLRLRRQGRISHTMTAHSLRHAFATHLLRNGAPVQDVSEMLGHACLETTQIYTHLVPMDLKEHHRRFHPRGD
jgi:integrase/recombinase XerD